MDAIESNVYQSELTKPIEAPLSEATKIEQVRVMAEVGMQAELAKRYPRRLSQVMQRIEETFTLSPRLVQQSKFSFRRGTKIEGFSIHFARAIAECVGNIVYSVKELARSNKQSEMFVYAWDLETNTMQSRSFIVPHTRDKTEGPVPLTKERDIYENNANNAAKRVRDCILGVLPAAARIKGEEIVETLLRKAYPKEQVENLIQKKIAKFKEIGVSLDKLVKERGHRPSEMWTRSDLTVLNDHYENIENGNDTIYDIFDIQPKITTELPKISDKIHKNVPIPFSKETVTPEPKLEAEPVPDKNGFLHLNGAKVAAHISIPDMTTSYEAVTELTEINSNNPTAILNAINKNSTIKSKIKKALKEKNEALAAEILPLIKKHIKPVSLSPIVVTLQEAYNNPNYFHGFEKMYKDDSFNENDIKTIILKNQSPLAQKALDTLRIHL